MRRTLRSNVRTLVRSDSVHFQWYYDSVFKRARNARLSWVEKHLAKVAGTMMPLADHQAQWKKILVLLVMWPALLRRQGFFDVLSGLMTQGVVENDCTFGRQLRLLLRLHEFHIPDVFMRQLFVAACEPDEPFAIYMFADMVWQKLTLKQNLDALCSPVVVAPGRQLPYSFLLELPVMVNFVGWVTSSGSTGRST